MYKALGSIHGTTLKLDVMIIPIILAIKRQRQGDKKLEVILSYIVSQRLVWAT